MYFPKSQIKTNLYTKGKFLRYSSTQEEYKGYYFETSTGEYFSGKTPQDIPVFPLELIPNNSEKYTQLTNQISINLLQTDPIVDEFYSRDSSDLSTKQTSFFTLPLSYIASTNLDTSKSTLSPKQSYPVVTENDYKTREFQRYFIKKSNEPVFLEISLDDYRKYVNQDRSTMFELYIPFQINWILTGDKEQVYQTNKAIATKAEQDQNLPGFTQYFKDRFTQFYK
jgi:hypothetical protein